MKVDSLTRDDVSAWVEDARAKGKNKKVHVRAKLTAAHPELAGQTIRRNGATYDVIDYLLEDIPSYGTIKD